MSLLDLSKLPVPDVLQTLDFEDQYTQVLTRFRVAMGPQWSAALESDPVMKTLELFTYELITLRARVNAAARATLLASATGNDLDHLLALLGAQRLGGEGSDDFRERGRQAPYGYSTAGPLKAYRYHALSAHPDIKDVWVDSPTPGVIRVTVLSRLGTGVPTAAMLTAVGNVLNADDIRPLNDTVHIEPAYAIPWQLQARLHFASGAATEPVMAAAQEAAARYAKAQHRLNTPLSRNMVIVALGVPGVSDVELLTPLEDLPAALQGATCCTGIHLTSVVNYA